MPNTMEPISEKYQSESVKARADKDYEAGRISGQKYERTIAKANKAGKKGRK